MTQTEKKSYISHRGFCINGIPAKAYNDRSETLEAQNLRTLDESNFTS